MLGLYKKAINMCGRFTLTLDPEQLREAFPWLYISDDLKPRFNIAPTQPVAVLPNLGDNKLEFYTWGLIPSWAKDPQIGSRLINARAETLAEKPSFRNSYRRRRCLIFADGFYEWHQEVSKKKKVPYYFYLQSRDVFAFAGLWDVWHHPDGSEIRSCTIITTSPNELVKPIHNRMPVIIPPNRYQEWLTASESSTLIELLAPYPASAMRTHPVSTIINSPHNDTPECIRPVQLL